MSEINKLFALRIGGEEFLKKKTLYRFGQIKEAKERAIKEGKKILDFGIGEPDEMASFKTIVSLFENANKYENRVYADNGCIEFNSEASRYLKNEYKVEIDEHSEVLHCIGAKQALNILPLAFINPGDIVLTTSPGYNVMANMSRWLGAEIYQMKLSKKNNFLVDFSSIDEAILKRAKLMYLNFPNNPTGAVATIEFFKEVIEIAKKYNIIIVHDAAYLDLYFDKEERLSFLSVEGAKDVGVEIFTLSKSHNMTGWRIGFIAGNKDIIKAYGAVKENLDSGQFLAIQKAAITALNEKTPQRMASKYYRRHKLISEVLTKHGFNTSIPKASFYQYVEVPYMVDNELIMSANQFALYLMEKLSIMVIPYDDEGKYVRFSMTFMAVDENDEIRVAHELDKRLSQVKFQF